MMLVQPFVELSDLVQSLSLGTDDRDLIARHPRIIAPLTRTHAAGRAAIAPEGSRASQRARASLSRGSPPSRSDVDHELDAQCSADAKQNGKRWVVLTAFEPRDGLLTHPEPPSERGLAETMLGPVTDQLHGHSTSKRPSFPLPAVLWIGVQMPCEHVLVGRQIGRLHVERDTKPAVGRAEWSDGGTL